MIVLDTHTFVWWVGSPKKLSRAARQVLDRDQDRRISAITLWEVATLVQLGRLQLDRDVEAWLDQALEESAVSVEPIDVEIAVRSTRIGVAFHGDQADRLIAATAIVLEATLVTADEQLHGCSAVKTVW